MSARTETAKALVELVLARLAADPQWRAESKALGQAIELLEPSGSAKRMRKLRAKSDVTTGVTSDAQVTQQPRHQPPSALPRSDSQRSEISRSSLDPKKISNEGENTRTREEGSYAETSAQVTLESRIREDFPLADGTTIADQARAWLVEQGFRNHDMQKWLSDLRWLAEQPIADLQLVAEHALRDPWVRENLGHANPGHLRKHWQKYLAGPVRQPSDGADADVSRKQARLQKRGQLEQERERQKMRAAGWDRYADLSEGERDLAQARVEEIERELAQLDAEARSELRPLARSA